MKRHHSASSGLHICKLIETTNKVYPKRSPLFEFKPISKFGENIKTFRQMAFNNRDRDFRIKVWILKTNWGKRGRDGLTTDGVLEVSAS